MHGKNQSKAVSLSYKLSCDPSPNDSDKYLKRVSRD